MGDAGVQRLPGWRPHRSVLWLEYAEDQTDTSWCGEYQGLGQLATGCRGAG